MVVGFYRSFILEIKKKKHKLLKSLNLNSVASHQRPLNMVTSADKLR